MCKFKDCSLEELFKRNSKELVIDKNEYCLFHSDNNEWKIKHNFADNFQNLINYLPKEDDLNLIGYVFPKSSNIVISNVRIPKSIKISHCTFNSEFKLYDCQIHGIVLKDSTFNKNIEFDTSTIESGGIFSESMNYNASFLINNTSLKGRSFFYNSAFNFKSAENEFGIKKCNDSNFIENIKFDETTFNLRVSIDDSRINGAVSFNNCKINNEFRFTNNTISGDLNFTHSLFTFAEDNHSYSNVFFYNTTLLESGRIAFKGKTPRENVVNDEMVFELKEPVLGIISFENFNLNKLTSKSKENLLELENQGLAEIGKGCVKYYQQTDIFTTETTEPVQELIQSYTKIFCDYFKLSKNYAIGISVVKRTKKQISYFYFTEDKITIQEFYRLLSFNEDEIWSTFGKLSNYAIDSTNNRNTKLMLHSFSNFLGVLKILSDDGCIQEVDIINVFNSISVSLQSNNRIIQGKSIKEIPKTFFDDLGKNVQIIFNLNYKQINNEMKVNQTIEQANKVVNAETYNENNYSNNTVEFVNTVSNFKNKHISDEQKGEMSKVLTEIVNEKIKSQQESKLELFFKKWGGLLTDVGIKAIKQFIM